MCFIMMLNIVLVASLKLVISITTGVYGDMYFINKTRVVNFK